MRARRAQRERALRGEVSAPFNALLSLRDIDRVATPDEAGARILASVAEAHGLSHGTVLRIARTIADLDGSDGVGACHVAEAISLRRWDTVGSRPRSA